VSYRLLDLRLHWILLVFTNRCWPLHNKIALQSHEADLCPPGGKQVKTVALPF
jgi:hypothetical protein